jgi:hypothetical protein
MVLGSEPKVLAGNALLEACTLASEHPAWYERKIDPIHHDLIVSLAIAFYVVAVFKLIGLAFG